MSIHRNNLDHSKSPYLQQHALNPVHWQAWNEEVLAEAIAQNKLIILSIGYSACHWCHVMEAEVFEKTEAAEIMNAHFISIKVDREERPDIDEIYMRALQLMKGQGGWPLNVVCLPDGKPVWGGTYVPLEKWKEVLTELAKMYAEDTTRMRDYADQLTKGIQQSMLVSLNRSPLNIEANDLDEMFTEWSKAFDPQEGGPRRAPKFPMPVNLNFLLEYGLVHNNKEALQHLHLSLEKMGRGGIYDQIGGGFARYSVDAFWKVPHFEKMLYDNAQLVALYSKAYRAFKNPEFGNIAKETWQFLKREMLHKSGAWYSALDADTEGEEGKYYVWTLAELQKVISPKDWPIFNAYYSIDNDAHWENGKLILLRKQSSESIAKRFKLSADELEKRNDQWRKSLLEERSLRVKPGLDNKALSSWNALMITAACEAYRAFEDDDFMAVAEKTADWILRHQCSESQQLKHAWLDGHSHIDGLLEDYTFCIEAFIQLWQITAKEEYLSQAKIWTELVLQDFQDQKSGLFFTRSKKAVALISDGIESQDNVIPSANSVMAHNLFQLGLVYTNHAWIEQAAQNLAHLKKQMMDYGESYANWGRLALYMAHPYHEIAIVGQEAKAYQNKLQADLSPLEFIFHSEVASDLGAFKSRHIEGKTLIYPCQKGACQLPYTSVSNYLEAFRK